MFNIQLTVSAQTVYHYLNEYISNSMLTAGKVFKNFNYIWLSIGSQGCIPQHMYRSDNWWGLVLYFHHGGTEDQTQVVQFGNKDLFH